MIENHKQLRLKADRLAILANLLARLNPTDNGDYATKMRPRWTDEALELATEIKAYMEAQYATKTRS